MPVSGRAVRNLLVPIKFFDSKGDAPGAAARVFLVEYELEGVLGGSPAFASCLSSGFDPACVLRALELDTAVFELIVHRPPKRDAFLEPFTDLLRGLAVCWQAPIFFGCPQRIDAVGCDVDLLLRSFADPGRFQSGRFGDSGSGQVLVVHGDVHTSPVKWTVEGFTAVGDPPIGDHIADTSGDPDRFQRCLQTNFARVR